MSVFASPKFLRNVLRIDAASCLASGAIQLAGGASLAGLLALPQPLLAGTGAFLLAYGAVVGWLSTRDPVPRAMVGLLAAGNAAWGLGCIGLLAVGSVQPSALGLAWVIAQAATVLVLAELQWTALRRQVVPGWA
jgi:hypothetical protein